MSACDFSRQLEGLEVLVTSPQIPILRELMHAICDCNNNYVHFLLDKYKDIFDINEGMDIERKLPDGIISPGFLRLIGACVKQPIILTLESVPPLVAACTQDNVEIVQYLVSKGADLNKQAPYWGGPLHVAAQYGCISVMKYLLDSGVDVNTTNYRGCTPLMMMCKMDMHPCVMYSPQKPQCEDYSIVNKVCGFLISRGSNIYQKTVEGYTAMHEAARCGRVDIIKILLEYGSSPLYSTNNSTSVDYVPCPLYLAAVEGHEETVEFFCNLTSCPVLCKGNAYLLLATSTFGNKKKMYWEIGLDFLEKASSKPFYPAPIPEYNFTKEIVTKEELRSVWTDSFDQIGGRYQHVLIRERCLGSHHISMPSCILTCALHNHNIPKANLEELCRKALNSCALNNNKGISKKNFDHLLMIIDMTATTFRHFKSMLIIIEMALFVYTNLCQPSLNEYATKKILNYFETWMNTLKKETSAVSIVTLPEEVHILGRKLVSLTIAKLTSGMTIFHCLKADHILLHFRQFFVEALLHWGAHQVINTPHLNDKCKRPLHILVEHKEIPVEVITLLLSYGAHIDAVDACGKTPLDYCPRDSPVQSLLLSNGPLPLSCFAARTIVSEHISYKSILLPQQIVKLIELHDPKCFV